MEGTYMYIYNKSLAHFWNTQCRYIYIYIYSPLCGCICINETSRSPVPPPPSRPAPCDLQQIYIYIYPVCLSNPGYYNVNYIYTAESVIYAGTYFTGQYIVGDFICMHMYVTGSGLCSQTISSTAVTPFMQQNVSPDAKQNKMTVQSHLEDCGTPYSLILFSAKVN